MLFDQMTRYIPILTFNLMIIFSPYVSSYEDQKKKELLDFISALPLHGIDVSSEHWMAIVNGQSENKINEIIDVYSGYLDQGRLNKQYFQPGWTIPNLSQYSRNNQKVPKIEDIQPEIPEYQYLIQALGKLEFWSNFGYQIFSDELIMLEDDIHPAVYFLNQWLMDLDLIDKLENNVYSQKHKELITSIQLDHNLSPDGRFGSMTRQALLSITSQRIRTVKSNLERIRWLPKTLPYPRVWVDMAGFSTTYHNSNNHAYNFKSIIGTLNKKTPVLKSEIENITINPVWKVPHSIASNSILKSAKKESSFLKEEGFKVYQNWNFDSPEIDINFINWNNITADNFKFRLEQDPGKFNRLGKFKLGFKNNYGVYLHDTDKPHLFEKSNLLLSSGCVRVSNIENMIRLIAMDQNLMNEFITFNKINTQNVLRLNNKIPIYIVYFTAWPDETGRVKFRDDIYKLDNALKGWF